MSNSAQVQAKPLTYALISIIALGILIFGFNAIQDITESTDQLETIKIASNFNILVKNSVSRSFGSIEEHVVALFPSIQHVCFVDKSKPLSPYTSCLLNDELEKYPDRNLFFSPYSDFEPLGIENMEIEENENPLCLVTQSGRLRFSLTNTGKTSRISTFNTNQKSSDCTTVKYTGSTEDKLDIVFVPSGYTNREEFAKEVEKQSQSLFETEPFKLRQDKINIYRIDRIDELQCEVDDFITCNDFDVKKLATFCPNDQIIVLVSRSKIRDALKPVRSSSVGNVIKLNTADNIQVLLHELGHSIGGLADEYVDDKYYSSIGLNAVSFPNCDKESCPKWVAESELGCFKGCSLSNFYRPTKDSLMKSLNEDSFGPFNEKIIGGRLSGYGESS
ncbi:MAG: M64 family metallo-endopeptidase [Nanoarchaeota archaeon]|nr:M64 family metallo-endopeptidase [Nanoarchaeota archaeon]